MNKHLTLSGLQTVLPPIKHLIDKKAESWDDLKGKPFGSEIKEAKLINNISITLSFQFNDTLGFNDIGYLSLIEGQIYTVVYDNISYQCTCFFSNMAGNLVLGNGEMVGVTGGNDEPFFIVPLMAGYSFIGEYNTTHTLSIIGPVETIKKIDSKYIEPSVAAFYVNADSSGYTDIWNNDLKEIIDAGKIVYLKIPSPVVPSQTLILPCTMNSTAESAFGGITYTNAYVCRILYCLVNNKVTLTMNERL